MNFKRELKKITKQAFPACQYPFCECRKYRKNLYNEMLSYWYNQPDCSVEGLKELFCGEESFPDRIPSGISKKAIMCLLCLGIIITTCIILFFFSLSWDAPTLY